MAYIVSVTTSTVAASTPNTVSFPTHAVGDLLLLFASNDGGATAIDINSGTGWAMLGGTGAQAASGNCRSAWAWKIATGTSGEDPSIKGSSDDWAFSAYVIRDVHASPFGSIVSGTDYLRTDYDITSVKGAITIAASALTTGADNCLLLVGIGIDDGNAGVGIKPNPDDYVLDAPVVIASGGVSHVTGHLQFGAAAATPALVSYSARQEGGNAWIIAVRNVASGKLQKDCRVGSEVLKWHGEFGNSFETLTYSSPFTQFDTTTNKIDGLSASATAPTVSTLTDALAAPGGVSSFADATNGGSDVWAGTSYAIPSTNMTGGVYSCRWQISSNATPMGTKGVIVVFGSGVDLTTNWAAYQLVVNPATLGIAGTTSYMSEVALGSATPFASHGSVNFGAITRRGFMYHRVSGSATSRTIYLRNEVLHTTAKLIGGNSVFPVQFSYLADAAKANGLPFVHTLQGSGQTLGKGAVQVGDGSTPTYFSLSAQSFEFPQSFLNTDVIRQEWNVPASAVGVTIYASASDTIDFSAGILATSVAQPFTIHASSSLSASYSFAGTSFVGWTVSDNAGLTWSSVTFKSGGIVTIAGGGDLTNCTISKTTSTNAALAITANGSVLTSTTVTVADTAVATNYHLELGTSVTAVTLADFTFSGTPAAVVATIPQKVHVLKTTGTVTITISGTTALADNAVTSAGATVVIAAPTLNQVVVVSGFTTGARVQIYDTTSSTELFNGTATAGNTVVSGTTATWTDPAAATASRAIRVRVSYVNGATAKNFIETSGLTCGLLSTNISVTYPVTPTADTTYNSNAIVGSGVTGITFVDSGSSDRVDCNIGGGGVTYPSIYAAFVYWSFTATGIANDFTYIDAPDTANYIFSSMKIRNTSATDLSVTGGYGRDATTGTSAAIIDTAGSTGNIFLAPDHVVAYATSSGVTAQNITDIAAASASSTTTAVLAAAVTTPIHADIRKVNSYTVDGVGSDANPWGPA